MVVLILNLTDAPGCKHAPTQVDVYNKTLDPGGQVRIPADLINKKIRALEEQGLISIGQIPSWYANAKAHKGRSLSKEEKERRIAGTVKKVELAIVGALPALEDDISIERSNKRRK